MAVNLRARIASSSRPFVVVSAVLALIVVLWLVVKVLPEELATGGIHDPAKRDEAIGRARTGLLAILAGGLAAIGAYYTHRSFGLNRETLELSRQGQITERFTRAVDQLGNESLDIRLGGIYALERLARESRDDHGPIIEILTAYIREHTRRNHPDLAEEEVATPSDAWRVATDIQAAITVLGRRILMHDPPFPWCVDLEAAHLEGANLDGAHLERARLDGAHLEGVNLNGVYLKLASLARAHLEGADLDNADLERARLDGANLKEAGLRGARLIGANLNGAQLERACLDDAHLEGAALTHAHLEGASLSGAYLDRASFARADLKGASLAGARLKGTSFAGAHLERTNFADAHLEGTSFADAKWSDETVWPGGFDPRAVRRMPRGV